MAWSSAVVVNGGLNMLNQSAGIILDYATGGTGVESAQALMAQTALKNQKQVLPIVDIREVEHGKKLNILVSNKGLTVGYKLQQIGVWAHMGDGPPKLFAILQDDSGIAVPAEAEVADFSLNFYAVIKYSGEASFSLSVDPSALVSQGDMQAAINDAVECKQDKLTGTKGQIAGFDAEGKLVAQDPPESGVSSFNGRKGAVMPKQGDYTAEDVGAVPTTRKVNGKALSADITLAAADVGAADSSHTHPAQTTVSGNAGTATKLATARTIDGVSFNGSAAITHYGTCDTAAATAAKVVTLAGFSLVTGAKVAVKFAVTNTAANPTLNVNSTGAKAIYYRGAAITAGYLAANRTYEFVYNGTQYELVGDVNWTPTAADVGAVPTTRKVNGKALSEDITLSASEVGAAAASHGTHVSYSTTAPVMDGTASAGSAATVARSDHKHPTDTSRAAANHTHTAADVGAVPTTRKVNGKALSADITLAEIVSYVGTGKYGSSNPCSITFSFVPKIVMMVGYLDSTWHDGTGGYYSAIMCLPVVSTAYTPGFGFASSTASGNTGIGTVYGKKSSDGKTISWYLEPSTQSSSGASNQLNATGATYYFLAVA